MRIPDVLPEIGSVIELTKPIRPANIKKFNLEEELKPGTKLKVLGNGYWNPYSNNKNWHLIEIVETKQKYLLNPVGLINAYNYV